jgi:hypothetical protein
VGVRRVGYGWSLITRNLAVATGHHQISITVFPDPDHSKLISFSSEIQQGLCVSYIVISLTYYPAHVKTEYKGAAAPTPFSFHTPPPLCTILLHYKLVDMDFPFFPAPVSSLFMFTKEVVDFWQQCHSPGLESANSRQLLSHQVQKDAG